MASNVRVVREAAAGLSEAESRQLSDLHFSGVPTLTLELFYQDYWRRIPLYRINPTWLFQEGYAHIKPSSEDQS